MPTIFKKTITVEDLQGFNKNSMGNHLGIEYLEIGDNYIIARMPVDNRTRQPFGILHGGASCVLAEELGSIASFLVVEEGSKLQQVGLEINANHLRSVGSGWVYGRVEPVHLGRRTHVWEIKIRDEKDKLVCISRLTVMLIER